MNYEYFLVAVGIFAFIEATLQQISSLIWEIKQSKWYRKRKGGKWYYMGTALPMCPFWTQKPFTSCQARILKIEDYETPNAL